MSTAYGQLQEEKDAGYTIQIKELSGKTHDFPVGSNGTVGELKKTIEAKLNHPANRQRLIWQGREFRNDAAQFKDEFKSQEARSFVVHLVVRPAGSTNTPLPSTQTTQPAYRYRQAPMQTVNCPFCRTMVQFPVGSRMIRCSSCGGISRIQVAQDVQKPCPTPTCRVTLSFKTNMQYIRCPKCVSTIETARWRVVKTEDRKQNT
uniref:Ubiquitin-like domain-containing protein n=1 Tax=Lotharella oceanica TaxID=641309 RepID=A0A7S2X6C9_9EUKA